MVAPPTTDRNDPLPSVLLVLSGVTGLVDAISLLGMGTFTANMTGNVVFLALSIGGAPGFEMPRHLVALLAFLGGAWAGGRIGNACNGSTRRRWLLTVAALEAALFWAAAIAAIGYDIERPTPALQLYALIVLMAVAMGSRNATVRQLKIPDLSTTVLTLTLTGLASESRFAGGSNNNWRRRIGAVLAMFTGAVLGVVLVHRTGPVLPLILCGTMVVLATAMYAMHSASRVIVGEPK